MVELGKYAERLSGIEIDPAHYPHGTVEQLIDDNIREYGLHEFSIRALIYSRGLVVARQDQSFRIAVTGKIELERGNPLNAGSLSIESLAIASSQYQAVTIAADLRVPYLRHYPGRCFRNTGESNLAGFKPEPAQVYIAFFDKAGYPPKDGV